MYPSGEIAELAQRKTILQARIAVRRWECAVAATELARPIARIDHAIQAWHRISPLLRLLAIPAGLIFARTLKRGVVVRKAAKRGRLAAIMSALPLIMRGVKMVMEIRAAGAARKTTPSRAPVRNATTATD